MPPSAWLALLSLSTSASAMPEGLWIQLEQPRSAPLIEVEAGLRKSVPPVPDDKQGAVRYAISRPVDINLTERAQWQVLPDGRQVGLVRILAPTATNLSLSFSRVELPAEALIWLEAVDGTHSLRRPITAKDANGEDTYTPLVRADEMLVTVVLPADSPRPVLQLSGIHVGVREFGHLPPPPQGSCNVDVVCPESAGWEAEIDSAAVYGMSGSLWCSGSMLNNTSEDQTPYFATAQHCGVTSRNDSSVVVYWNFESEDCGDLSGGSLDDWQMGSTWRMEYRTSDWTLLELDDVPDAAFEVAYAGWDRSGTTTTSAVSIHHPGTDEKAISFENDATTVTDDYSNTPDSSGSHIRVADWDDGTTEGGSSGSPLFDQNHRVIGVLTGGYAACGNNESDWYGRLYRAWTGDGSSDGRLSNWLDPSSTGDTTTNTLAPHLTGIAVAPSAGLSAEGDEGGPFSPSAATWTLSNRDDTSHLITVATDVSWADLDAASVTVGAGGTADVTVTINASAESLAKGKYEGTVTFTPDDGSVPDTRTLTLLVGSPEVFYFWDLSTDPGWDTDGDWEWGVPEGDGGQHGYADPTSGASGTHVYGYNLAGDYDNRMRAQYLTTAPIDMSDGVGTTLRFQRWLGVEEPEYDQASIQVTADGGRSWTVVWENDAEITDRSWRLQEVDLSEVADGESEVQIRWVMGETDEDYRYCGWNIDDIAIFAIGEPPDMPDPVDTGDPIDSGEPADSAEPEPTDSAEPTSDTSDPTPVDTAEPVDSYDDDKGVSGCACSASRARSASGWLLVGLAALGWRRRRRD